jgi:hypothetical protein
MPRCAEKALAAYLRERESTNRSSALSGTQEQGMKINKDQNS